MGAGRAAGLRAPPVKPAQLQASSLRRRFISVQFVVQNTVSVGWYFTVKDKGISLNATFV